MGDLFTSVSLTPDGRHAILGSSDKSLRVWDLENGQCVAVFAAAAGISATAIPNGRSGCLGTEVGQVVAFQLLNIDSGSSVLTSTSTGSTRCVDCGLAFAVPGSVIASICAHCAQIAADQSPCLELPEAAFADRRLLSGCPHCDAPVKFNPFFSDSPQAAR